jgi:hypothetical protein
LMGCQTSYPDFSTPDTAGFGSPSDGRLWTERIVCVKLCKWRSFWAGSGGLAELGFLVLLKIVHVEISVRLEPVFVGLDSQRSDEAAACV